MQSRRSAALAAALVAALIVAAAPARAERIRSLVSTMEPTRGGGIRISEQVAFDFGGARRHEVEHSLLREAEHRRLRVRVRSVTDAEGRPWAYEVVDDETLVIASGVRPMSGQITFHLEYEVQGALTPVDGGYALHWTVAGGRGPLGFDAVDVAFVGSVAPLAASCEVWGRDAADRACAVVRDGTNTRFSAVGALAPGQGLRVDLTLPDTALRNAPSSRPVLPAFAIWWLLPLVALGAVAWSGIRRGGLRPSRRVVDNAPPGLGPGYCAALWRGRASVSDLATTLIDLAGAGHVDVVVVELDGFVDLRAWDHLLVRTHSGPEKLRPFESMLLDIVFEMADEVPVHRLRLLDGDAGRLADRLFEDLAAAKLAVGSPRRAKRRRFNASLVLLGGALIALAVGAPQAAQGALAAALIMAIAAPWTPARTARGRRIAEKIAGWRRHLGSADEPADASELAHALGLEVADRWIERCADDDQVTLSWYDLGPPGTPAPSTPIAGVGRLHEDLSRALTTRAPVTREFTKPRQ